MFLLSDILFSELLLVLWAYYLCMGSIFRLLLRRNRWFAAMWAYVILIFLTSSLVLPQNLFIIFSPDTYKLGNINTGILVSCAYWWIMLISAIIISVVKVKRNAKRKTSRAE